jgi:outer membrane protein assembly factor BamB
MILSLFAALTAHAHDWPQFRGPGSDGVAEGVGVPTVWSETENIAWRADVPGDGWSAPIVVGDRVLLTTAVPVEGSDDYRFEVHCYALDNGDLVWKQVAHEGKPREPTHRDNTFASETPVTDGERVYAYFGMNALACYTLDGEPVWKKDLGAYPMDNDWGTSSGPVVAGGKVFIQIDNETDSHLVALNSSDGSEAWRAERPDEVSNWSTPIIWQNSQRTELVVSGRTVRSYDPTTGELLWSLNAGGRSCAGASPLGDILYLGNEDRSSRGGPPSGLYAVKAGASGMIDPAQPNDSLLWANQRGAAGISSPLVYDGLIYVPERRGGMMRVHDTATGEQLNRKRLPGSGVVWASPLAVDGRVLVMDESGKTFAIEPGADLNVIGTNQLEGGRFWSTPAVTDGTVLIRSASRLYCVRATGAT